MNPLKFKYRLTMKKFLFEPQDEVTYAAMERDIIDRLVDIDYDFGVHCYTTDDDKDH